MKKWIGNGEYKRGVKEGNGGMEGIDEMLKWKIYDEKK